MEKKGLNSDIFPESGEPGFIHSHMKVCIKSLQSALESGQV